jgi:hypothetical protein
MTAFQGASSVTAIKEAQIYGTILTRLRQRKFAGEWIKNIRVYDMLCGDGINIVDGLPVWGSPIEITRAIIDSEIASYKRTFFTASDIREDSIDRLRTSLGEWSFTGFDCKCIDAKAQIADTSMTMMMNPKDHAIVLIDPNGPATLPFDDLIDFCRRYSARADLFINISETHINRNLGCSITKDCNWWANFTNFAEILCKLKSYYKGAWLREAIQGDRQRWRYVCFWNYAIPKNDWKAQNLLAIKTNQDIIDIIGNRRKV